MKDNRSSLVRQQSASKWISSYENSQETWVSLISWSQIILNLTLISFSSNSNILENFFGSRFFLSNIIRRQFFLSLWRIISIQPIRVHMKIKRPSITSCSSNTVRWSFCSTALWDAQKKKQKFQKKKKFIPRLHILSLKSLRSIENTADHRDTRAA